MKKRKIGIRFYSHNAADAIDSGGMIELYDVETGEAFEGIIDVIVKYRTGDIIQAEIELYVQSVDAKP